jgi:hypothetical protein
MPTEGGVSWVRNFDAGGPYLVAPAWESRLIRDGRTLRDEWFPSKRRGWVEDRKGTNVLTNTNGTGAVMTSLDECRQLAAEWNEV